MAEPKGYAKVAMMMCRNGELGIFRRFGELNFRNLLYLQAELIKLEGDLQELAQADQKSDNPMRRYYDQHWPLLSDPHAGNAQWNKMLEIRRTLREYNDCLLQQKALSNLAKPAKYHLDFLRDWLVQPDMGNFPIISKDRDAWEKAVEHDLITLENQSSKDFFTSLVCEKFIPLYHRLLGHRHRASISWDPKSRIACYPDDKIQIALDALGTTVSCLMPITATVALYYIQSMAVRLGVTAIFTAVFSLALCLMTKARRVEIFAATAAFAAVLVVFLGTNNSPNA
ncbi:hypothetical protein VTN77DRAFT_8183 [Rasamsonia byssochlamydoides]|uniref:uncharacterized protein n=1 Tax=Rasamsonia byssochlamydoides TaxID=89139 RepID=UPI0037433B74